MKTMLLAGATLMIGASVYGIVDYRKNSHRKEFKELYKEETVVAPTEDKDKVKAEVKDKVEAKVEAKAEIKTEVKAEDKAEDKDKTGLKTTGNNDLVTKFVKKKRRLRSELFSRAPLKDEYYELKVKDEKVKVDTAVVVKKDE